MTVSKFAVALLSSTGALALSSMGFAQAPDDILANATGYKPVATFSDTYAEKILTTREDGFVSHDVAPKPEKIAAKIVANIQGFDFAGEIDDTMAVGVHVGGFEFEATLGDSNEAQKFGPFTSGGKKKATFPFIAFITDDNGNDRQKTVGSITFAWSLTTLTVTLKVTDVELAGVGEIAASTFVGLYVDESENGNRPSGKAKFSGEPIDVDVTFGSAVGARMVFAKGVSSTSVKRYGKGDEAEEFPVQAVKLSGSIGKNDPQ